MITGFGFAALVLGIVGAWRGATLEELVILSVPFEGPSVINVHGTGIPPFYIASVVLLAKQALVPRSYRSASGHGHALLWILVAYAAFTTVLSPILFAGIPTLNPHLGIDGQVYAPTPLGFSASNIDELTYLVIAAAVAVVIGAWARGNWPRVKRAFRRMIVLELALTAWQYAAIRGVVPYPTGFFNNNPARAYVTASFQHGDRLYGTFPEPSLLTVFLATSFVFLLASSMQHRQHERFTDLLLAVGCISEMILGATGTALASLVVLPAVGVGALILWLLTKGRFPRALGIALPPLFAVLVVATIQSGLIIFVLKRVQAKERTTSYSVRTLSDTISATVFYHTDGIGAGLGSNRPSSFLFMLISCVGVVGTLLFLVLIVHLMHSAFRADRKVAKALAAGLGALVLVKAVSSPDLSTPYLWALIGVLLGLQGEPSGSPQFGENSVKRLAIAKVP